MRATFLALVLGLSACATTAATGAAPSPAAARLPDFELNTVDGDSVRLSDYVGRSVIVLSFWDTWCEPCRTELPHLDRIYRAHKDEGLAVFAISMDDPSTVAQVAPYVRDSGFSFPVLLDTNTQAANLYNEHKSAPHTVVIDRKGTIVSQTTGFEPGSEKLLEEQLVALLGSTKAP